MVLVHSAVVRFLDLRFARYRETRGGSIYFLIFIFFIARYRETRGGGIYVYFFIFVFLLPVFEKREGVAFSAGRLFLVNSRF